MKVTEIILAKILIDFVNCRVTVGFFFLGYRFLNTYGPGLLISLVHKAPSYDTNLLPKVVFDKTVFVKCKISNVKVYIYYYTVRYSIMTRV